MINRELSVVKLDGHYELALWNGSHLEWESPRWYYDLKEVEADAKIAQQFYGVDRVRGLNC